MAREEGAAPAARTLNMAIIKFVPMMLELVWPMSSRPKPPARPRASLRPPRLLLAIAFSTIGALVLAGSRSCWQGAGVFGGLRSAARVGGASKQAGQITAGIVALLIDSCFRRYRTAP